MNTTVITKLKDFLKNNPSDIDRELITACIVDLEIHAADSSLPAPSIPLRVSESIERDLPELLPPDAPLPDEDELLELKRKRAKAFVDQEAENQRMKYITPGDGQAIVYAKKAQEVQQYRLDQNPDPKNYPLLTASLGIDGDTLEDIASVVESIELQWKKVAADIERKRLLAKRSIQNSASIEDIEKAAMITW